MIVHFEINVADLFGCIRQTADIDDKRYALQDQVCLAGFQDVFAQA